MKFGVDHRTRTESPNCWGGIPQPAVLTAGTKVGGKESRNIIATLHKGVINIVEGLCVKLVIVKWDWFCSLIEVVAVKPIYFLHFVFVFG